MRDEGGGGRHGTQNSLVIQVCPDLDPEQDHAGKKAIMMTAREIGADDLRHLGRKNPLRLTAIKKYHLPTTIRLCEALQLLFKVQTSAFPRPISKDSLEIPTHMTTYDPANLGYLILPTHGRMTSEDLERHDG